MGDAVKVLVLHGPNLNLLGEREVGTYGKLTLNQINRIIRSECKEKAVICRIFQTNSEGKLIDLIQRFRKWADGIIINPAAYTHYSYAIRDAISAIDAPVVEVHLSNIKKREPFRRISVIAPVCVSQIYGKGPQSYLLGIRFLLKYLNQKV